MEATTRSAAARQAYRNARWWATRVMGLASPLALAELCLYPLMYGHGSVLLPALWAVLLCAGCWGIWVGSAALVGWCRGR